jgi:hypothetical protein
VEQIFIFTPKAFYTIAQACRVSGCPGRIGDFCMRFMGSLTKHGAGFFNGRLTAVGNARIASRAARWKIAGFTVGASQIWDIPSSLGVSMASLSQAGIHPP